MRIPGAGLVMWLAVCQPAMAQGNKTPQDAPRMMAADANPSFEVATIKPNDSGVRGLQQLTFDPGRFVVKNGSLEDLLGFAFRMQTRQLVALPEWASRDRYDIKGVPDREGSANDAQVRGMVLKLLEERFGLKYHHEKHEMPAFVLTAAKSGVTLKESDSTEPLPRLNFAAADSGLMLRAGNAMTSDVCLFLQSAVLDRPVVDQTGLTGRYNITVIFTPDDSQFNGRPPQMKAAENVEPAPGLFQALLEQAGLKLSPEKAMVDVVVIDHVEKPSAN